MDPTLGIVFSNQGEGWPSHVLLQLENGRVSEDRLELLM